MTFVSSLQKIIKKDLMDHSTANRPVTVLAETDAYFINVFNRSYLIEGLKLCPKFVRSGSLSKHIPCADLRSDSKLDYRALSLNDSTQTTP